MADLLVVADDLTGALDTGACFARHGLRTRVTWSDAPAVDCDVWVLDTESRDLPPASARERLHGMVARLPAHPRRLYKKVDSTLRGNVGAELEALLQAAALPRAVLAPAFPAQGRTTRDGRQFVHGVPLVETPLAGPGDCSSIAALLAGQTGLSATCLALEVVRRGPAALAERMASASAQVLVVDAEEDADLHTVAEAAALAGPGWLLAGSAGLAAALAASWGPAERPPAARPGRIEEPILLVAGTRHPCLAGQLARLQAESQITVVGQVLGGLLVRGEGVIDTRARDLVAALVAGDAILTTHGEPRIAGADGAVAAVLARIAAQALERVRPGALVLTGGDVAMAVCRALGAEAVAVGGELEPGVPWGRLVGGRAGGLALVTKAGGFGDDGVLARVLGALRGQGTGGTRGN